jgi:hippurate hydrolase
MIRLRASIAAFSILALAVAAPAQVDRHFAEIASLADREYESLDGLYLHLHQNPELSYFEEKTGERLAEEMRRLGFEVATRVGGFGVVCVMRNGEGPTVMLRTDTDALPVTEATDLPYASKIVAKNEAGVDVGVMHACGHDIHMTCWIGAARVLTAMKDKWSGTLVMIAQPAEERGGGAKAMLADGLFARFPRPDFAVALHVEPSFASGEIAYTPGYAMANVDSVDITVRGVGGHGAYPHTTKDPIVIGAQIVLALQTIVSREVRPIDPAVVTVGAFHAGSKHNIISGEAKLQLTVRSYTDEVRALILASIRRIAEGVARTAGVPENLLPIVAISETEFTPATYNDPELAERTMDVARRMLGADSVFKKDPVMGGEDFSRYGREEPRIPIFMFNIGTIPAARIAAAKAGGPPLPSLHSEFYHPEREPSIKTGVRMLSATALELLGAGSIR